MLNEKLIHSINLNAQNRSAEEDYEYPNQDKLQEVVEILTELNAERVSFYNDPVGELANAVNKEMNLEYYRMVNDYRISHSFAKKLFGLDKSMFEGMADAVVCQHFSLPQLNLLLAESNNIILVSPDSNSIQEIDRTKYFIDTKMYCAVIKKIRGLSSNDIIIDEVFDE